MCVWGPVFLVSSLLPRAGELVCVPVTTFYAPRNGTIIMNRHSYMAGMARSPSLDMMTAVFKNHLV